MNRKVIFPSSALDLTHPAHLIPPALIEAVLVVGGGRRMLAPEQKTYFNFNQDIQYGNPAYLSAREFDTHQFHSKDNQSGNPAYLSA